jgi:hypothetical protein
MFLTKYGALFLIISYYFFVTLVVNSIPDMSAGGLPPLVEQTPPQGLLFILDAILGFLGTFWGLMTFSIPDVPAWVSSTFIICAFMMFFIIVALIRGVD